MDCEVEKNKQTCACKSDTCERRGRCCLCVAHHRAKNQLPTCLRSITVAAK
jgi:hypothetical protein